MPRGAWTAKDERKYEAIFESCRFGSRPRSKKTCQRIAAATVNRDRKRHALGAPPTCPPLRFTTQDRGDRVLVWAHDGVEDGSAFTVAGWTALLRADRVGDALQVKAIQVDASLQRCGVGTRLYEEIAKVACAEGRTLRSDRRRTGYSEAFWRKQASKGRATCTPGSGINLSYKDRSTPKEIRGKTAYWRCQTWSLEDACREGGLGRSKAGASCPHAERFHALVNMRASEIRAWAKDPRSKLASWASTRSRLPALATLKAKPVAQWTEADCRFAARVVSFNARMDGMRKEHGCTTKIDVSLRNWGRKAPGCKLPRKP